MLNTLTLPSLPPIPINEPFQFTQYALVGNEPALCVYNGSMEESGIIYQKVKNDSPLVGFVIVKN